MPRKKKAEVEQTEPAVEPVAVPAVCGDEISEDRAECADDAFDGSRAVTFRLDGELYGLPIGRVQEIQQIVELRPIPDDTPGLMGLIDVRGLVVPVLDLRLLVGLPPRPYTLETPMVFCVVRGRSVALIVDSVEDVVEIDHDAVQPPTGLYSLADKIVGVCRLDRGLLLVLDIERLVPDAALAAAGTTGGAP